MKKKNGREKKKHYHPTTFQVKHPNNLKSLKQVLKKETKQKQKNGVLNSS